MVLIELIVANPPGPLVCWASWIDSGGCSATVRRESGPAGLILELGVGVGLVTGVGIECGARLAMPRNELNEETATSGD